MRDAVAIKRVYEAPADGDGSRFLVDGLWPRGVKRDALRLDGWLRALAPSASLRRWFKHDPKKWPEFRERYEQELRSHEDALAPLIEAAHRGPLTLLTAVKDLEHAHAQVLRHHVCRHLH
jgi:uncharacterized protein YeaO (DUF488 family)